MSNRPPESCLFAQRRRSRRVEVLLDECSCRLSCVRCVTKPFKRCLSGGALRIFRTRTPQTPPKPPPQPCEGSLRPLRTPGQKTPSLNATREQKFHTGSISPPHPRRHRRRRPPRRCPPPPHRPPRRRRPPPTPTPPRRRRRPPRPPSRRPRPAAPAWP